MQTDLEFILGILDCDSPPRVAWDDFQGPHGDALRFWQGKGFLSSAPEQHPVPTCPHCDDGTPYFIDNRYLCNSCRSDVDPRHRLLWRFDLEAFLAWLASSLTLSGGLRQLDARLWQLGTFWDRADRFECFFTRPGPLSKSAQQRLLSFRNALLLRGSFAEPVEAFQGPVLSLVEILHQDGDMLSVVDLRRLLWKRSAIRFIEASGSLFAGDLFLGDVTVGSKEHQLLAGLWRSLDRFVPYADLKHEVLRRSGSTDTTEEATFCQKLKSRIKKRIPTIDRVIATTNKGDGFRLRGYLPSEP